MNFQIFERTDYHTDDPYIKELINEEIRKEISKNLNPNQQEAQGKQKRGKNSDEQNRLNLKNNDNKFKYINAEGDDIEEVDYEEEEDRLKRDREMQIVEPPRFKIIGYVSTDKSSKIKRKPILRMSDLYLSTNSKVKRIINHVFERQIYGRVESKRGDGGVIMAKTTSNAAQLEQILKQYENHEEDYGLDNQQAQLTEAQLEEYIIDRNQSKQQYFLYYKQEHPKRPEMNVVNNPMKSQQFLGRLHREVQQLQRKYYAIEDIQSQDEAQPKEVRMQIPTRKVKEYFGQFHKPSQTKTGNQLKLQDSFCNSTRNHEALTRNILDYYSYIDNDVVEQKYKLGLSQNDRLELNLTNPYFFQPKLHAVLNKDKELMLDSEYKAKLAEANKANPKANDRSLLSGQQLGRSKLMSAFDSDGHELRPEGTEQDQLTIEKVIETQMKNVYRQPLKHSELASGYQFVKFTLEEDCFQQYHRYHFPFNEHLSSGRVKVEPTPHKSRKVKPNGLVLNAEMKESNQKFSRRQDLSLVRGQFIAVEYLEETPLLMSDVGMCERMFIQVNYLEVLQKVRQDALHSKSFEEMEEEREKKRTLPTMGFQKHCELWRKNIKDIFGENGKQFYWEPNKTNGKLIGTPEGSGVALMESNLCTIPIVRKKSIGRDFLLVREGKKWVIRRVQNLYISGQVQPHKKVFCPGSRQHTQFKLSYEKAFILKQIRQYGSVNFDQLKLAFKCQTENSLRRALKNASAVSKDGKNYKLAGDSKQNENDLTPQDVCLYQRMQKSLLQLKQVGIRDIRSNQKMKNVLKEFNRKHFLSHQKITIARMIREQLQLTSWYLTDSFLKYKQKASKIQINGFADPTNGKGGYSYINKPQKERTSKEDMEDKADKQKTSSMSDLRKLNCDSSRERLREMGHNQNQIQDKGRWQLITLLKNKEGTEFSRRERETKNKKIENEKKQISKNFNRLLNYLHDLNQEPAFDYSRQKRNKLLDYMEREREYWQKIKRKYGKPGGLETVKEELSNDSEEDD